MIRICGVCVIKDATDLVPFLCGHYLRIGFDRLVFIDDGSSDGTFEKLQAISRARCNVSVQRASLGPLRQAALMTEAANQVIADGYNVVFPFDSDEFWNIDAQRIRATASAGPSGVFVGHWVNFVASRRRPQPSRRGLLAIVNRAPALADVNLESVQCFQRSFVCVSAPKIGFKADGPVQLERGQHRLAAGPTNVLASDLEAFHLPLRSINEIDRRARRADRFLDAAAPGVSWQSRHFRDTMAAGRRDDVWKANSAGDDGCLDLGGSRIVLIPDTRLRTLLARAWLYYWALRIWRGGRALRL
jgi:hypothetical protein